MAKSDRILDLFPAYYRATDRNKLLAAVVAALAGPLEEADTHLFRIQRSHRLRVAEQAEDIVRLAALLNLTAYHFEDLLTSRTLPYEDKLDLMRERVRRVAAVHLQGLGTPWAVLEAAAIFLDGVIVPQAPGAPLIVHMDRNGYSHKATVEFRHALDSPRAQIFLHENPFTRRKSEPAERWPMNCWALENRSAEPSSLTVVIQGVDERTILPSIFCPATGEGIVFEGIIPDGQILVLDETGAATLGGDPVDDWLIRYSGGIYDYAGVDTAPFVVEQNGATARFDPARFSGAGRPERTRKAPLAAGRGRSEWVFKVVEGRYDGSEWDYAVYATNPEPIGRYDRDFAYDEAVFDYPPSGVVGMGWDERVACSFKLLLPVEVPVPGASVEQAAPALGPEEAPSSAPQGVPAPQEAPGSSSQAAPVAAQPAVNYAGRIGVILSRFRAAGVRAFVDQAGGAWVLGESVLRSTEATEGAGIDRRVARLTGPRTGMYVVLETSGPAPQA